MKITNSNLEGVRIIEPPVFKDQRGLFVKVFHKGIFSEAGLSDNFAESYYSVSRKGCIRGMHFQTPPQDHAKLVYVSHGTALDVIVDIRKGSPTYGQFIVEKLTSQKPRLIYVPSGFAHGFLALTNQTYVTYLQTTVYSPDNDKGISALSFGFDWPVEDPIMSERDKSFPTLDQFNSPFSYKK